MSTIIMGGRNRGKQAFIEIIMDNVCDGDLQTKLSVNPYPHKIREEISVNDMMRYAFKVGAFLD